MANQNLSQFTEKLFVADADHTFIWDTVGAISKRVSRNSWLNSGTLTSDAPVTISQTWNNAAVAFTGLKVNAAGTSDANSASGSLLLDLQLGGVSKIRGEKNGTFWAGSSVGGYQLTNGTARVSGWGNNQGASLGGLGLSSSFMLGWSSGSDGGNFGLLDTMLFRDGAANTLALRNGAVQQMFRVYGTYSDASNYRRLAMGSFNTTEFDIQTEGAGSGVTAGPLNFGTAGVRRMTITTAGNVGIGTTSPSSKLHVAGDVTLPNGGSIFFGGGYNIYGTTTATSINGPTAFGQVAVAVNGSNKWVFNYDGLLCGGGTTAAFPALKRSTTYIQARLADDTAFAPIQGKLTTDTAYTGTVVAATGYITIYDSTGTAYRVPCAL